MTKWDTIQLDVADAYRHLDDELELENEEKKIIEAKIDKLDKMIKKLEDYAGTGFYSVNDIQKQFEVTTFWYYFLLVVNFIIFIIFCIFFYFILSVD